MIALHGIRIDWHTLPANGSVDSVFLLLPVVRQENVGLPQRRAIPDTFPSAPLLPRWEKLGANRVQVVIWKISGNGFEQGDLSRCGSLGAGGGLKADLLANETLYQLSSDPTPIARNVSQGL